MSTKILARNRSVIAEPVVWRSATGIPPDAAGESPKELEKFSEAELAIVRNLRHEAEELQKRIDSLEAEAKAQIHEAFERGKEDGDARARQELNVRLETEMDALRCMTESLVKYAPRLRQQTEQELVRLAVAIARRILYRELKVDPDALLGLVKVALDKINMRELHEIRVNDQDVPLVARALQKLEMEKAIKITGETQLLRGSLLFETNQGNLDASIETQLQEMQRGFADLLNRVPAYEET